MPKQLLIALLLAGATGTAAAQTATLEDWDSDANGALDAEEFRQGMRQEGWFDAEDDDDDGRIVPTEFGDLGEDEYGDWDANSDGYLEDIEYETGFFTTWDINDDGLIGGVEWDEGYGRFWADN